MNTTKVVTGFEPSVVASCRLPLITVYKNPKDFPTKFVARLWDMGQPTEFAIIKDTLKEIHESIPEPFYRLGRMVQDDPVIIETWVG